MSSFYETVTAAVADLIEHGYDSSERVALWLDRLREAARRDMLPEHRMREILEGTFRQIYRRLIENGQILKLHPGIPRFTLERVRPQLQAELNRRIFAAADLIRLNRQASIEKTLQRFGGWASSIPAGGTEAAKRQEVKDQIRKPLASLPYEERRVLTDQGHKFAASLNLTLAEGSGAIAVIWKSHWRRPGYNYREDHKERDGKVYMLKGNWAQQQGLVKPGPAGYYDDITHVGEEVYCSCDGVFIYFLRSLPEEMLTAKGRMHLNKEKAA